MLYGVLPSMWRKHTNVLSGFLRCNGRDRKSGNEEWEEKKKAWERDGMVLVFYQPMDYRLLHIYSHPYVGIFLL